MQTFRYRAKDSAGKTLTGKVEAGDATAASKVLQEKGLIVIKLQLERKPLAFLSGIGRRIGGGEVATFTRQLSTMISAGVTITEALSILRSQASGALSDIIEQLRLDVEGGSSLASSMEKHSAVFSPVYVALIRAGETGGLLDVVLTRLADNLERQREFQGKVKGVLIYPAIVIIGMVAVATIMMIFVVPRLSQIYKEFNTQLPLITRVLIAVSNIVVNFWYVVLLLLVGLLWGFSLFRRTPFGKRKIDELSLRLPIIGPLSRQIMLTEFVRTLGLLVGAGVSILESLGVVSRVVGNEVVAGAVRDASREVEKGFPLAWALGQRPEAFPPMMTRMLAVGEETGKLDEILGKVSHIFEVDSEQQVRTLTAAIEPIIMVVLGIGVGLLVIGIIMPIYNLTSQF